VRCLTIHVLNINGIPLDKNCVAGFVISQKSKMEWGNINELTHNAGYKAILAIIQN